MATFKDLTNQRFGKLTVLNRAPNKNKKTYWNCRCDCGNFTVVRSDQLTRGITHSCGCLTKIATQQTGLNNFKDLTNQRFGKLIAIKPIKHQNSDKYYWICKCDCGNIVEVRGTSLTNGNTQSCGCLKSKGESTINLLLNKFNINYQKEYSILYKNKQYRFDFAIFDNNNSLMFLLEFDGIQHFGRISGWFTQDRWIQLQQSDKDKTEYCKKNQIPLLRIRYDEDIEEKLKEFLKNAESSGTLDNASDDILSEM